MKVVPDFSTPLNTPEGNYTLDHRYDYVRLYPEIGHAIINVVTNEGVARLHTSHDMGLLVAKKSLIVCQDMDYMGESDYEKYIQVQQDNLESWFE